jgi:hypothetical protein
VRALSLVIAAVLGACSSAPAVDPGVSSAPSPPGVVGTGSMAIARATHSATLLADGTVLVAGGYDGDCHIRDTELYDPATRAFRQGPSLSAARCGHSAIALRDGRLLLVGGWGLRDPLASADLFDPGRGTFASTGSMSVARGGGTATLLGDGTVLVTGGTDGTRMLASAERYDPRSGLFAPVGNMTTPRSAHTATLLADGRVLIAGGSSARDTVVRSAEIFDPASARFATTGPMTVIRHKHGSAMLPDGRVLVVGGADARDWNGRHATAELYDARRGIFEATTKMSLSRFKLPDALVPLSGGMVLVAGGAAAVELFDSRSASFTVLPGTLGSSWFFATATPLRDGSVLVTGGYDDRVRSTSSAWVVRP